MVTSAVTLVALGGFIYYGPIKTRQYNNDCKTDPRLGDNPPLDDPGSYLANGMFCAGDKPRQASFRNKVAGIAAAAVGGIALFAVYKGFIATKKESSTQTSGRRVRKKKQFAVTPIVSPEGGGATFRLDW